MRRIPYNVLPLAIILVATSLPSSAQGGIEVVQPYDPPTSSPSPQKFEVCYKHTCKEIAELTITENQWNQIRTLFQPLPASAAEERKRIAAAVGRMEILVGKMIDTSNDKGGNLQGFSAGGNQMDCVDESTNTTTYLTMMERAGLLKWHQVEDRRTRNLFFFGGWPHTTAVIRENDTDKRWAVDSWFYDNGVPPAILPLEKWRKGWKPPDFKG